MEDKVVSKTERLKMLGDEKGMAHELGLAAHVDDGRWQSNQDEWRGITDAPRAMPSSIDSSTCCFDGLPMMLSLLVHDIVCGEPEKLV